MMFLSAPMARTIGRRARSFSVPRSAVAAALALLSAGRPAAALVQVLGFSADGKRVVLLDSGAPEGGGTPWAQATVLDVASSRMVGEPIWVALEDDLRPSEEAAVAQVKTKLAAMDTALAASALRPGRKIDSDEQGRLRRKNGEPIGSVQIASRVATAKEGGRTACEKGFRPLLLSALLQRPGEPAPTRVAAEWRVRKDQPCAAACQLGSVHAFGRSTVFMVECSAPGDEESVPRFGVPLTALLTRALDTEPSSAGPSTAR